MPALLEVLRAAQRTLGPPGIGVLGNDLSYAVDRALAVLSEEVGDAEPT